MERGQNGNGGWKGHPPQPKERTMNHHRKLLPAIMIIVTVKIKVTITRR
jgi:hypothetical protein